MQIERERIRLALVSLTLFLSAVAGLRAEPWEPPFVLPQPQQISRSGEGSILLGQNGRPAANVSVLGSGELIESAAALVKSELAGRGLSVGEQQVGAGIMLMVRSDPMPPEAPVLSSEDVAALGRSEQAYVIRMQPGGPARVWLIGASPLGVYYAAATLVQLIQTDTSGSVSVPWVEVRDWPDIERRMCADWVLDWDWEVNGYDWGDGLDAFIARCKARIDLCARYKVNRVRFLGGRIAPGPAYMKDRYARILRFAKELNAYARRRGVGLQYSSTSFGIDHYGWGLPWPEPWILNRESYPDGKVYECCGRTAGGCLSNDALIDIIARRQVQLVRDIEPSCLYLHNVDIAMYKDLAAAWKQRCARCRERFPDDEPYSSRGYAAAVAGLYNRITPQLKAVRNADTGATGGLSASEDTGGQAARGTGYTGGQAARGTGDTGGQAARGTGYDAARDLEITFASPGYSYWPETDAEWASDLKYFTEIARQVKDKRNVQLTFREQFNRLDGRGLRTREMADSLAGAGWPGAMLMFAVQGADFLDSPRLFTSSPVLTCTFDGVGTLYNFNGHVFSELQVLANVNYAWNLHAAGAVEPRQFAGPALRDEAFAYSTGKRHSEFLYDGFLDRACGLLYGEKAAPSMAAMFRLERDKGPIVPTVAWLDYVHKDAAYDWRGQASRNREARTLVDLALSRAGLCESGDSPASQKPALKNIGADNSEAGGSPASQKPALKYADLRRLGDCLEVAARICDLTDAVHREKPGKAEIDARAGKLLAWLEATFPFQVAEPDGGDPGQWKATVQHLRDTYKD